MKLPVATAVIALELAWLKTDDTRIQQLITFVQSPYDQIECAHPPIGMASVHLLQHMSARLVKTGRS
jgi:hypothetical protein